MAARLTAQGRAGTVFVFLRLFLLFRHQLGKLSDNVARFFEPKASASQAHHSFPKSKQPKFLGSSAVSVGENQLANDSEAT